MIPPVIMRASDAERRYIVEDESGELIESAPEI